SSSSSSSSSSDSSASSSGSSTSSDYERRAKQKHHRKHHHKGRQRAENMVISNFQADAAGVPAGAISLLAPGGHQLRLDPRYLPTVTPGASAIDIIQGTGAAAPPGT
ncbi:unnamed protein product, partial [Amoebophrya sp. A25]